MMNLIMMPNATGAHLGGWRHPDAWTDTVMNLGHVVEAAQIAERGKFDAVFLADGNAVREMDKPALFAANFPSARPAGFEPATVLSAVAMKTEKIGLVATTTTSYDEPYSVARRFASIDHISNGRAGWNVVTSQYAGDALNYSRDENFGRDERYDRAEEFVEVVKGLWDSWDEDAFPQDKATGQYLDPGKVHTLNHKGTHFSVKGPLNIARPPQGHPLIFMAGQSDRGRELAAKQADAMFGAGDSMESCQRAYADIKSRMAKYGRAPDELRFIPGISIFVGRTEKEADDFYRELQDLISPTLGVHYLSKIVDRDLTQFDLDEELPEVPATVKSGTSLRTYVIEMARREKLTIRQTYQRVVPALGSPVVKGTPAQVADKLEEWYRGKACDGFMISNPVMPRALLNFVGMVVPELQKRGLFRKDYEGDTLRQRMGLPTPASRYTSQGGLAAE
ncbi:LLM class flavin-dependent oxidoreductase [Rhodovarius crocodyli]|uniref:LLM class flavin-dependent oxidoreductase n=1 Tax=Rhodovarius crocodyli TaxID=1979269 RepID=A0A437MLY3_9PROT|nr:LLM class flavin-dependent oxidoreductase [Rhodovarius crocodyli]RVT98632.1 LLM class flavin-dependent oxidoreductase [Rhodovarius crocodyli]